MLNNPEVISANTVKYSPLYYGRNPEKIDTQKEEKWLYNEDRWKEISATVEGSISRVANKIRSGKIEATPAEIGRGFACDFCKFMPICRKGRVEKLADTEDNDDSSDE